MQDNILLLNKSDVDVTINRLKNGFTPYFGKMKINSTGCWLGQKATNKPNGAGYIKLKVFGSSSRKEFYAHHLVLITDGRTQDLIEVCDPKNNLEISHLCHNSTCFNPRHLIIEKRSLNLQRNKCMNWKWISCPCPCNNKFNPCQHNPKCILPND